MDEKPALVFLDHMLNGGNPDILNGIDALPKIKVISPFTKVIMLTGQNDLKMAESMMAAGAYFYITKDENCIPVIEKKVNLVLALA
jgi:DNA-binding NarL/FixJ family response regulator